MGTVGFGAVQNGGNLELTIQLGPGTGIKDRSKCRLTTAFASLLPRWKQQQYTNSTAVTETLLEINLGKPATRPGA